jgi:hypothetical protein
MEDLSKADVRSGSRISDPQFLCLHILSTTTLPDQAMNGLLKAGFFTQGCFDQAC